MALAMDYRNRFGDKFLNENQTLQKAQKMAD